MQKELQAARMKVSRIAPLLALLLLLPSCGNRAKHEAAKEFRDALAAMKVACHGTLEEFRQSRVKLDTVFEANKEVLPINPGEYAVLHELLLACQICWAQHLRLDDYGMVARYGPCHVLPRRDVDIWLAMVYISPELQLKTDTQDEARMRDPDFTIEPHLARGLAKAAQISQGFMARLAR